MQAVNRDATNRAAQVRPGPHERYALRLADMHMREASEAAFRRAPLSELRELWRAAAVQQDIAANEARRRDSSEATLVMRLRRMVQP